MSDFDSNFVAYLKTLKAKDWNKKVTGAWTVKDVVAHMVGWEKGDPEAIRVAWKRKEQPWWMQTKNYDAFNKTSVEFYKAYSPEALIAEWEKWRKRVKEEVDRIGERHLRARPDLFGWLFDEGETSHYHHHYQQIKNAIEKHSVNKKSYLLIAVGAMLVLVAVLGALFPFVPFIFADAEFLSQHIEVQPNTPMLPSRSGTPSAVVSPPAAATATPASSPSSPKPTVQNGNALVIQKIGVSVPIVEGRDARALLRGAWRYPGTATPPQGANTVIFGHRFRYLPPNNTTFYNLDKLVVGDEFTVEWQHTTFHYRVTETKIIQPTDFSVVQPTQRPTVTLITCSPLFSTRERLVVVGEQVLY